MIKYELRCGLEHRFQAWFRNGETYESQAAAGLVTCPICGDTDIAKAPMAPSVRGSVGREDAPDGVVAEERPLAGPMRHVSGEMVGRLAELCRKIEQSCEHVGGRFAEEARKIHYGETEPRDIYGEASAAEAAELRDEGVTFGQLPWVPRTDG